MTESTVDKNVLRTQYGDDERLSARQRLWESGPDLVGRVLDLAGLRGGETVLDVGCGNGRYLAELRRRGHTGPLTGLDFSPGMASVSRAHAPTVVADAQALPVRGGGVDVALCLHMLYHVPDLPRATAELRRVLRPGGTVVVVTNGPGHTAEPRSILARALREVAGLTPELDLHGRRFEPATAAALLAPGFDQVAVYPAGAPFIVSSPDIVTNYLGSIPPESTGLSYGPLWTSVLGRAYELIVDHFDRHGSFQVTSDTAVIIGGVSS